jgi:hypothetical protein
VFNLNVLHYTFNSLDNKASEKDGYEIMNWEGYRRLGFCLLFNGPHYFDVGVAGIRKNMKNSIKVKAVQHDTEIHIR